MRCVQQQADVYYEVVFIKRKVKMIDWLKKTSTDLGAIVKNTMNTPAPIGKTVLAVLIIEGMIIGSCLVTHKVKVITIFL